MDLTPITELRLDPRTNIFVVATLYSNEGSAPVRIRNMSRSGALIEGAVLPPTGSAVKLCRGSLTAAGDVIWLEGSKAGVRFGGHIAVADWFPNGRPSTGQQLADELAHQARLGAMATQTGPISPPAQATSPELNEELLRLSRSLEQSGENLATDESVAERFPGPLQAIDMAAQALAKLAGANRDKIEPPLTGSAAP